MALTLGEAARHTGKARFGALNSGRIADHKSGAGEREVDEASLLAIYPPPGGASGIFRIWRKRRNDDEKGTDLALHGE